MHPSCLAKKNYKVSRHCGEGSGHYMFSKLVSLCYRLIVLKISIWAGELAQELRELKLLVESLDSTMVHNAITSVPGAPTAPFGLCRLLHTI